MQGSVRKLSIQQPLNLWDSSDSLQNSNGKLRNVVFRDIVQFPSTTYGTFGLYQYPAKFIPHVIAYVLDQYARPGMKVFDPFSGCGTVGIMSRLYGIDYELWDLNPLMKKLHQIAIMKPLEIEMNVILRDMLRNRKEYCPSWERMGNWFPSQIMPFLARIWGYYHSMADENLQLLITVPLLKTTRYFSFDDMQRQKLTKSSRSMQRVARLMVGDWKQRFMVMFQRETIRVLDSIVKYNRLGPKKVKATIRAGVDSFTQELKEEKDILITSPPYMQSQEYIRQAKIDLYWLGHTEDEVRKLGKLEIPYRKVQPIEVYSETFHEYESKIEEDHIRSVYDSYFWGTLGALTRMQKKISSHMFLFVGHSSTRGRSTPIDSIIIEHFTHLGWEHKATLSDTIVGRRLFKYRVNPATGAKDARTSVENLVILKRN